MSKALLRPFVTTDGQAYVDEPVYVAPKPEAVSVIALSVAEAFNPRPGALSHKQTLQPILVHHERVRLRWMKPNGKGGLVPR